ncbi:MAG: TonB-dependent receptor, partial [Verrucomicrobiota bacterium]
VLLPGRLALRGSVVKQHDGFELKPSGVATERYNGMVKVRPFKTTTVSGSYSFYKAHGSRPNATPPRDGITGWLAAGSPTWDPPTSTLKINGVASGTFTNAGVSPAPFNVQGAGIMAFIDQAGLSYLGTGRGTETGATATNTPLSQTQVIRLMSAKADPSGFLAAQPLLQDYPVLADRSLYDWSSLNIAAQNRFEDRAHTSTILIDQIFLDTRRQTLALQLGWFQELTDRTLRNLMGTASATQGFAPTVSIDVNERLIDGQRNPYFLRPFVGLSLPQTIVQPQDRNIYRAQLAYRLDLREEKSVLRFLGMHQLSGYAEYKNIEARQIAYRDSIVSNHPWLPVNTIRGGQAATNLTHRFYVGDAQGNNVDYAPTAFNAGTYTLNWGNGVTGAFNRDPVSIDTSVSDDQTGGARNTRTILKSQGGVLQSHFLRDRLVTTFGLRADQRYSRNGVNPVITNGVDLDYNLFNQWSTDDWAVGKGNTTTAGVVLKPLRWLSVFANRSDSFQPAALGLSLYRQVLPDPTGVGEDYGVALNFFDGKLVIRANRYKTVQINTRNGDSANIAQRAYRMDFQGTTSMAFTLQRQASLWINEAAAAQGIALTSDQLNQRVADVMGFPFEFVRDSPPSASAVDDFTAKGTEIEINFNPTAYWTTKLNVTEQLAINSGLAAEVGQYAAERLPIWQRIIDPRVNRPWWTETYSGGRAADYYATNVRTPLQVAQAMQGKSRPQIRKYRANFATNYRLAGLTDHRILRRFNIGGALRWEDKGAIGYRGVEQLPAIIETLDVGRPIYDKARLYPDAFIGYKTKIFKDKVGMSLQFNVRNLTESGRLQPIAAEADGRVAAYRIIDPRLFIFTANFSL